MEVLLIELRPVAITLNPITGQFVKHPTEQIPKMEIRCLELRLRKLTQLFRELR